MPDSIRSLPENPSIEQQRKQARELLTALQNGDAQALARVRVHLPNKDPLTLADTQFAIAREYGFESWAELKRHIEEPGAIDPALMHDQFRNAFERRDAHRLRKLFTRYPQARAMIDAPVFPFDSPALAHFAGGNNTELIDVLLEFGADPNRRTSWWAGGFHPLHRASTMNADRLIRAGAIIDACAAAHLDRIDPLRDILDADPSRVHERGGDGQTPLHFARSRAVIDLLLERGADIDARDVDHRATPAQWMLARRKGAGRYQLAQYLVDRGAAVDVFLAAALGLTDRIRTMLEQKPSLLDARIGHGEYDAKPPSSYHIYFWSIGQNLSPLQVATQFDQGEAADIIRSFLDAKSLFVHACAAANGTEARRLLREHPDLMRQLTPSDHRTLADAAWQGSAPAVELMIDLGFDPAVRGHDGGNALHCAAWQGTAQCVKAILRHPARHVLLADRDPSHGATPFGWCAHGASNCGDPRADHAAVARLLLEAGAEPSEDAAGLPESIRNVLRDFS